MKRVGFSMIELVFVIVIVGILSAIAVPRFSASRIDACFAKLRANLSETETVLSREYTRKFLQGSTMSNNDLMNYLKTIEANNSATCSLKVSNESSIIATISNITINLRVTNSNNSNPPTITCDAKEESCRKLTGVAKP